MSAAMAKSAAAFPKSASAAIPSLPFPKSQPTGINVETEKTDVPFTALSKAKATGLTGFAIAPAKPKQPVPPSQNVLQYQQPLADQQPVQSSTPKALPPAQSSTPQQAAPAPAASSAEAGEMHQRQLQNFLAPGANSSSRSANEAPWKRRAAASKMSEPVPAEAPAAMSSSSAPGEAPWRRARSSSTGEKLPAWSTGANDDGSRKTKPEVDQEAVKILSASKAAAVATLPPWALGPPSSKDASNGSAKASAPVPPPLRTGFAAQPPPKGGGLLFGGLLK
eukprot:CAMPEP_0197641278 /NCGR_PEP_ID=MMETSP1338-20131121/15287_1 /TAXON_ID=43686 ORGANISM="Pelagodinium beii, Strain RCC1491" /NCGR_SAMPLE_ID=MMETSP1338 /ASSEMBLY_ACC=CAM_ASM_000754 /LENGTH=278 /DNA_ID=CAMNT_0043214229 /DNA_START=22 /DNA_END=858 /DNA_ORIENTATION=+